MKPKYNSIHLYGIGLLVFFLILVLVNLTTIKNTEPRITYTQDVVMCERQPNLSVCEDINE